MTLALYALSLALPVLSHVTRQSMACASVFPPVAFTAFLVAYACGMLVLAPLIERRPYAVLRVALPCFAATFCAACVASDGLWFLGAWASHALASAALWPVAFQFVHQAGVQSRLHLALWSLQGNVGDFVGCTFAVAFFDLRPPWLPFAGLGGGVLVVWLATFAGRDNVVSPLSAVMLLEEEETPPDRLRTAQLLLAGISIMALKSASYFANDFLPALEDGHYEAYNLASFAGVALAGLASELRLSYSCTACGAAGMLGIAALPDASERALVLGGLQSFCSTMLSICICSDLAGRRYARTTAYLDAAGTLTAAAVQLVPKQHMYCLQLACSGVLCVCVSAAGCLAPRRRTSSPLLPAWCGWCGSAG